LSLSHGFGFFDFLKGVYVIKQFFISILFLFPAVVVAQFHLLARAGVDHYSLPYMSSLSNTNPSLNDASQTLFRYWGYNDQTTQTEQRLWLTQNGQGRTIYTTPDEWLITDPKFYGEQTLIFSLSDFRVTGGLWRLDLKENQETELRLILDPKNIPQIEAITSPALLSDGSYTFRGMDRAGLRHLMNFKDDQLVELLSEGAYFKDKLVTYVFLPFVREDALALKVSFENHDEMMVRKSGEWKTLAQSGLNVRSMQNNLGVNALGEIAFIGVDNKGFQQVFKTIDGQLISSELIPGRELISHFETFAPSMNDQGQVAFRALDVQGRRSLFLWNKTGIEKLGSEGDQIPLEDGGTGRIFLGSWGPGFAGAPSLNNKGEISFAVTLMEKHQDLRIGSALYMYRP
jgi:hypothetical protein